MIELGCQGFQETDAHLLCYIDKSQWDKQKFFRLKTELTSLLHTISANAAISMREIQEENWNDQWERSIQPIEIGKRLVIKPSWGEYTNVSNRTVIQIDPKMSFGTGYHETTRLTLQLLEQFVLTSCTLLDVGTGTGILSIAAVKLGAASAVGIDIDSWSIENAQENIKANHVQDAVVISDKSMKELHNRMFDIITANLTLNTNIELLEDFSRLLRNNGILLLSGLLINDEELMVNHLSKHNFHVEIKLSENDWIALACKRTV